MNFAQFSTECAKIARRVFTPLAWSPTWNDSDALEKIWAPYAKENFEELGTVREARKTISDCRRVFTSDQLGYALSFRGTEFDRLTEIEKCLPKFDPSLVL